MTKGLFIIDFDLTISEKHVHNLIANAIASGLLKAEDTEAQWLYIKNVAPIGGKARWKNLFATLLKDGHNVAIASFCDYKPVVERYLRETIQLDEETMQQIYIESWLPKDANSADKSKHLANVINHFKFKGKPEGVILIDDSKLNCLMAREKKHTVIEVVLNDNEGQHIDKAMQLSKQLADRP